METSSVTIPGYLLQSLEYESTHAVVYRGIRNSDVANVVIKLLKNCGPEAEKNYMRLQTELEFLNAVTSIYVCKGLDVLRLQSKHASALVLEDFDGVSLQDLADRTGVFSNYKFSFPEFLNIAIQACRGLEDAHAAGIVHKDIKPGNICMCLSSRIVKLIDFSISCYVYPLLYGSSALGAFGTVSYMAPEMTGRLQAPCDFRCDIYSLGVSFYHLLCGRVPFEGNVSDIIAAHCTVRPPPLERDVIGCIIPFQISLIIYKMMEKHPRDRYQNIKSCRLDLERCQNDLLTQGVVSEFPLGTHFNNEITFKTPSKIYGVESAVKCLKRMLTESRRSLGAIPATPGDSSESSELTPSSYGNDDSFSGNINVGLINGEARSGKSSLLSIFEKECVTCSLTLRVCFTKSTRNHPFHALRTALSGVTEQLSSISGKSLSLWKCLAIQQLNPLDRDLLYSFCPRLAPLVGTHRSLQHQNIDYKTARLCQLTPSEVSQIPEAFSKLIGLIELEGILPTLLLDDLQWCDSETLGLLQDITGPRTDVITGPSSILRPRNMLIVGTSPTGDTSSSLLVFNELRGAGNVEKTISLKPLNIHSVTSLISDCTGQSETECSQLAQITLRYSNGSAELAFQFLRSLYCQRILRYDDIRNCWIWNFKDLADIAFPENAGHLGVSKLRMLSERHLRPLAVAACFSSSFNADKIGAILGYSVEDITALFMLSLKLGVLLPSPNGYYEISHAVIRYTIIQSLDTEYKQNTHLDIAQLLLSSLKKKGSNFDYSNALARQLDGLLFIGLSTLLTSLDLVDLPVEVLEAADQILNGLNSVSNNNQLFIRVLLIAGQAVKSITASLKYYRAAFSLILKSGPQVWQECRELTFSTYVCLATAECLYQNTENVVDLVSTMRQHVYEKEERLAMHTVEINLLFSQGRLEDAMRCGLSCLKLFDVQIDYPPSIATVYKAIEENSSRFEKDGVEGLSGNVECKDPVILQVLLLMSELIIVAEVLSSGPLFVMVASQMVQLTAVHGNTSAAQTAYALFGFALTSYFGKIVVGDQFMKLGLQMAQKTMVSRTGASAYDRSDDIYITYVRAAMMGHWRNPYDYVIRLFSDILNQVTQTDSTGKFSFIICCFQLWVMFSRGTELFRLSRYAQGYHSLVEIGRQKANLVGIMMVKDLISALTSGVKALTDPNVMKPLPDSPDYIHVAFHAFHVIVYFLFDDLKSCKDSATKASQHIVRPNGSTVFVDYVLFSGLCFIGLIRRLDMDSEDSSSDNDDSTDSSRKRDSLMFSVNECFSKFKTWASYCPENFEASFFLLQAEIYDVDSNFSEACRYYNMAIKASKDNNYLHLLALSQELYGRSLMRKEQFYASSLIILASIHIYDTWGATAKVTHMVSVYAPLFTKCKGFPGMPDSNFGAPTPFSGLYTSKSSLVSRPTSLGSRSLSRNYISVSGFSSTMNDSHIGNVSADAFLLLKETSLDSVYTRAVAIACDISGADDGYLVLVQEDNSELNRFSIVAEYISAISLDRRPPPSMRFLHSLNIDDSCESAVLSDYSFTDQSDDDKIEVIKSMMVVPVSWNYSQMIVSRNVGGVPNLLTDTLPSSGLRRGMVILLLRSYEIMGLFDDQRVSDVEKIGTYLSYAIRHIIMSDDMNQQYHAWLERFISIESMLPEAYVKLRIQGAATPNSSIKLKAAIVSIKVFNGNSSVREHRISSESRMMFINSVYTIIGSIIRRHSGVVVGYGTGSCIAFFREGSKAATSSALEIVTEIRKENCSRLESSSEVIGISIGISCGSIMVGAIGDTHRVNLNIIGDAVAHAKKLSKLSKLLHFHIVVVESVLSDVPELNALSRYIGSTRSNFDCVTNLYELFGSDGPKLAYLKSRMGSRCRFAIENFQNLKLDEASLFFADDLTQLKDDPLIDYYLRRITYVNHALETGVMDKSKFTGYIEFEEGIGGIGSREDGGSGMEGRLSGPDYLDPGLEGNRSPWLPLPSIHRRKSYSSTNLSPAICNDSSSSRNRRSKSDIIVSSIPIIPSTTLVRCSSSIDPSISKVVSASPTKIPVEIHREPSNVKSVDDIARRQFDHERYLAKKKFITKLD